MPIWPFFSIPLGVGAVALVSLDLDNMAPLLIPAIFGYAYTCMLDISYTTRAGASAISKSEYAILFRVSCRRWGITPAILIQMSAEIFIILVLLPVSLGYGPFHSGSISAICFMAAATHLWGFTHNYFGMRAPEYTKF